MKSCPFCAEEIQEKAMKCKYCKEFLQNAENILNMGIRKRLFDINEISVYLGLSVSAVRKWVRIGRIPFVKLGGKIMFDIQKIDKWILKSSVKNIF